MRLTDLIYRTGFKGFILLLMPVFFMIPIGAFGQQTAWSGEQQISATEVFEEHGFIQLTDLWRFSAVDSPDFANINVDDENWDIISTRLAQVDLDFIDWESSGWFRLKLHVDSTMTGIPLAIDTPMNNGQAEIYMNGKPVNSVGYKNSRSLLNLQTDTPHILVFDRPGTHVLAVRYINALADDLVQAGRYAGFHMQLYEANRHYTGRLSFVRLASLNQFLFTGSLLVFALIHVLLFAFYPTHNQNLYFAIFTMSLALVNLFTWQLEFTNAFDEGSRLLSWLMIFKASAIIFFMRFAYAMYFRKLPIYFWFFAVAVFGDALYTIFMNSDGIPYFLDVLMVLFCIEIIRITIYGIMKKRTDVWIFGTGIIVFIVAQIAIVLNSYGLLDIGNQWLGVAGVGVLLLTMSVSLSRNVALTSRELKNRLDEVKLLSEKSLEQERINREQEVSRRLLQADNERKTLELDDARRLQLSMLPDRVPKPAGYDISVKMITASEVGGDYYDFYVREDGSTIAAVGDATGHGLKAGMIVATVRSYFHTLAHDGDLLSMLRQISVGIRNMNVSKLYMGLTLIKIKDDTLELIAAGMPPLLHYSAETGKITEIRLKGLPLGGARFPYQAQKVRMESDDFLIAMSDGLIEAFNPERTQFSIERMMEIIRENGTLDSEKIIRKLLDAFRTWTGSNTPDDDITLMLIRKK